jgi:hypothetical protein
LEEFFFENFNISENNIISDKEQKIEMFSGWEPTISRV